MINDFIFQDKIKINKSIILYYIILKFVSKKIRKIKNNIKKKKPKK